MAKGELTVLRCMRIRDVLRAEIGHESVQCDTDENTVTITTERGEVVVLRPVSIVPVT
jgi:hypothetical protein